MCALNRMSRVGTTALKGLQKSSPQPHWSFRIVPDRADNYRNNDYVSGSRWTQMNWKKEGYGDGREDTNFTIRTNQ